MSWRAVGKRLIRDLLASYDVRLVRGADLWHPTTQLGRQPAPPKWVSDYPKTEPVIRTYLGRSVGALQTQFDFAVVMPSILRESAKEAIASVFAQDFSGRVQLLIGVDAPLGDPTIIDDTCRELPPNYAVQIFYPGYSTSRRHQGLHYAWDGGAMRTVLSYLANSRYLSYLDDDNWYAKNHLSSMHRAIQDHDWAYSLRWYVHPRSRKPICEDRWESIGPAKNGTMFDGAGWVDPNCLAIDKIACEALLAWWSIPQRNSTFAMDADRNIFRILAAEFRGRGTNLATAYYTLTESDPFRHPIRLQVIGPDRYAAAGLVTTMEDLS